MQPFHKPAMRRGRLTGAFTITEQEQRALRAALSNDGWLACTTEVEQTLITKGFANYQPDDPDNPGHRAGRITDYGRNIITMLKELP